MGKDKKKVTYDNLWGAICLRSGRDAFKVIAREYETTTIFIPALSCYSMILPFRMYGHIVQYYRLQSNYTIDLQYLKKIIEENGKNGIFLYMNYFGIISIEDSELWKLKKRYQKLIFVEDRTHNLIWKKISTFQSDYIVASIRKWINIPDGGLLWSKRNIINNEFLEDTDFSSIRLKAQCMRNEFFNTGDLSIKMKYRKIFSTVSDIIDKNIEPCRMSTYSYEIIKKIEWENVRNQRESNAKKLIEILKNSNISFIQDLTGLSDLYVAVIIKNREQKQYELSSEGIFGTIIWPLSDKQRETCDVSGFTEKHMLAISCDQRYDINDMKFIGRKILEIIE